ncbi:hypothetical protein, partial [Rubripirellula obstinata]|uniref:hypothetical protein n=1 Tax=Rubripirellula obstinata TaxID=406547 RepID=UPI001EE481EB
RDRAKFVDPAGASPQRRSWLKKIGTGVETLVAASCDSAGTSPQRKSIELPPTIRMAALD